MNETTLRASNRLLLVMGLALIGLIALAAIVLAFREPNRFPAGTPEATVQDYILAVFDDDPVAAHAQLSSALQARCQWTELETGVAERGGRVTLRDSTVMDTSAVVEVEITATYTDDPFDVSTSSFTERFVLAREAGEWRISEIPWPFYWCEE